MDRVRRQDTRLLEVFWKVQDEVLEMMDKMVASTGANLDILNRSIDFIANDCT